MPETEILNEKVLDNRKVILQTLKKTSNNGFEFETSKIILPYLSDDELLARYNRIKPIISENDLYYYLKKYSVYMMRNQSYIWQIKKDKGDQVDMTGARVLDEFSCYHTCGYIGFFKPSVAEVLQQFPDDLLDEANAFYMFSTPETTSDLNRDSEITNAGCHKSRVRALVLRK